MEYYVACILGVLLLLFLIFLFLIAPGAKKDVRAFTKTKFAHRGLHNDKRAENSMSAFAAAVEAGYGIELDVRLSRDGELVVFHDDTLDRVVGREGRVDAFTADELGCMSLSGTADGIPLFADVLQLVDGKVPLLVEIKEDAGNSAVSTAAANMLKHYEGDFLVESFNPLSIANFAKTMPEATAGILSHKYYRYPAYQKPLYFLLQCLLLNRVCRPSFIAFDHNHASSIPLRLCRSMGAVTFAWTVRSAEEAEIAYKNGFDSIIFEGFLPEKE